MRVRLASLAFLAVVLASPTLGAQQWRFGLDAGRIRSTLDPVARQTVSLVAGAGYESATAALRLSAGVPTPSDSVRWGAIAAWKRLAATHRGFTAGLDLSGNAFAFRMPTSTTQPAGGGGIFNPFPTAPTTGGSVAGRALAGQVLPLIAYDAGQVQVQARAGLGYHNATAGDAAVERTARVGDLQVVVRPAPTVALIPTLRHVAARDEQPATFAGASVIGAAADGRLQLRAEAGRWVDGVEGAGATAWALGAELRVAQRLSLGAGVRKSGFDPVYLSPDQTSWSLGASIVLGERAPVPVAPVAVRDARGTATITLPVSRSATAPRVAGDFNGWTPAPMQRDGNRWRYTVAAKPGVYNYAFVAADGTWFVPEGTPGRKDDGMGGHVAVVVIR